MPDVPPINLPPVQPFVPSFEERSFDPRTIRRVTADPANVPVRHTTIDADKRFESVESASRLSDSYSWFVLGLAYCLVKVDRSLFEVFQAAGNVTIPLRTHRADRTIMQFHGADLSRNPWAYTIQGIPAAHARRFTEFVASYRFARRDTGHDWCVHFHDVKVLDPFSADRHEVQVQFALPANLTKQRRVILLNEAARLHLEAPVFGVTNG